MQIFVDADACPVVGIIEKTAKEHNIPVTLLCDTNLRIMVLRQWHLAKERMRFISPVSGIQMKI